MEEIIVMIDFALMALLWMTRTGFHIEGFKVPAWSSLFQNPKFFNDGTVAIFMALPLYFVPSNPQKDTFIMN